MIPASCHLPSFPLTTRGPPLSPSQLSCPPEEVPAHRKMLGIHSFCPEFLYIFMHWLLEMIGRFTSLSTGEICPYSESLPHPVTQPRFPTRSLLLDGRQIGIIFGWKSSLLPCICRS